MTAAWTRRELTKTLINQAQFDILSHQRSEWFREFRDFVEKEGPSVIDDGYKVVYRGNSF